MDKYKWISFILQRITLIWTQTSSQSCSRSFHWVHMKVMLLTLKPHCTTYSYLRPLYSKQCLICDHWSPMILFFLMLIESWFDEINLSSDLAGWSNPSCTWAYLLVPDIVYTQFLSTSDVKEVPVIQCIRPSIWCERGTSNTMYKTFYLMWKGYQ